MTGSGGCIEELKRFITVTLLLYLAAGVSLVCLYRAGISDAEADRIRNTEANDILFTVRAHWPAVDAALAALPQYSTPYIVTDADGRTIAASEPGLQTDYTYRYFHRDFSADIIKDEILVGRVIFVNDTGGALMRTVGVWAAVVLVLAAAKDIWMLLYLRRSVFLPAKRMNVLSEPTDAVDARSLGIFAESFALLQEEIAHERARAREADRQRREVIAAISHDIRNPVASIQAVAEFQALTAQAGEQQEAFATIVEKTGQIQVMMNNLHTSALDELARLTVSPEAVGSMVVADALKKADFCGRIQPFVIPECLIMADTVRTQQVMDNLISNSYKYADTAIEVRAHFEEELLCVCVRDAGRSVKKEEEIFLAQKYFRGENAKQKEGSGMGLYLAAHFMKEMGGRMACHVEEGAWFEVRLWFLLAV